MPAFDFSFSSYLSSRRLTVVAAIGFCLITSFANAVPFQSGATDQSKVSVAKPETAEREVQFAADKNEPVLVFGFGELNPPRIEIFQDGTVKTAGRVEYVPELKSSISKDELQKLVRFAIDKAELLETSTALMKGNPGGRYIADGPTSVFKIHVADGKNMFEVYALSSVSKVEGASSQIKNLMQLQDMCNHIFYLTQIGTADEQDAVMALAIAQLEKELPGMEPFTMSDLYHARRNIKGKIQGAFSATRSIDGKPYRIGASFKREAGASEFTAEISKSPVRRRRTPPSGGIQLVPSR